MSTFWYTSKYYIQYKGHKNNPFDQEKSKINIISDDLFFSLESVEIWYQVCWDVEILHGLSADCQRVRVYTDRRYFLKWKCIWKSKSTQRSPFSRKLHESPSRLEQVSEHPVISFPALFRVWHYIFLHITIWSMPTSVITDCQVHGAMPMSVSFTMCSLVSVQNSTDAQTVDWKKKRKEKIEDSRTH